MSFPTFGDVIAVRNAPFLKVFTAYVLLEGPITPVPATKSRLWPLRYKTETPVHPQYCVDAPRFGGPHRGRTCEGCYEGHASPARILDRSRLGGWASPPSPDSSPPDAAQKCNCQLGPLQPRPNLTRLHKCNFQLQTCKPCPERTRKSKCSLFQSCRGVIRPISATKQPDLHFCNQLHFSVHPNGIANMGIRPRPYRGAHVSALIGSYAQRLDRSHWTAGPGP